AWFVFGHDLILPRTGHRATHAAPWEAVRCTTARNRSTLIPRTGRCRDRREEGGLPMAGAQGRLESGRPGLAALLLGLLLVLTGCSASQGGSGADPSGDGSQTTDGSAGPGESTNDPTGTDQLTIAVVGDSITVGSDPTFAPGQVSEDSWVRYAVGDPVELAGGWARWGATTAEMAAAADPVPADVLVIMAGTNDLAAGTPTAQVARSLEQIVAEVGADEVLLCAVPPL